MDQTILNKFSNRRKELACQIYKRVPVDVAMRKFNREVLALEKKHKKGFFRRQILTDAQKEFLLTELSIV